MGAVQKLATIVVVGLTALATLLVVYVANEPNRTDLKAEQHEEAAIERGIETYIQQCVACHGPGGAGALGTDGRIGFPLNPHADPEGPDPENADDELNWRDNQSDDPFVQLERYNLIVETLHNGRGLMPAFGRAAEGGALLNNEQIHELATMITHVDWDRVYNETIEEYAGVYPTPPPPAGADAAQAGGQGSGEASLDQGQQDPVIAEDQGDGVYTIEGFDIGWDYQGNRTAPNAPIDVTVPPGATISLPNVGEILHNFSIDELEIDQDMPVGETVSVQIPPETAPGTYVFYCDVPGHVQAGMIGNLIVDPAAPAVPGSEAVGSPAAGEAGA